MRKEMILSAFQQFMKDRGEGTYHVLSLSNGMIVAKTQTGGLHRFAYNADFCKPAFKREEPALRSKFRAGS